MNLEEITKLHQECAGNLDVLGFELAVQVASLVAEGKLEEANKLDAENIENFKLFLANKVELSETEMADILEEYAWNTLK